MSFMKLPRDYYTPNGWRLATFEEAKNGRETIEKMGLLEKWERARLLDGWISGPHYDFEMGNDFRSCMGYMLVIKLPQGADQTYEMYQGVSLDKARREVALLLCTEDCNYQVIYWVLKSSGRNTMTPSDVSEGKLPFSELQTFKTMKSFTTDLACALGRVSPVTENAAKKNIPGSHSVHDILGDMIKLVEEQHENPSKLFHIDEMSYTNTLESELSKILLAEQWFGAVASRGGADWEAVAEAFWNFWCEYYASLVVMISAILCIQKIVHLNMQRDPNTMTRSQENFIFATDVLYYTAACISDIIHAPLVNYTQSGCAFQVLHQASDTAKGDPQCFNQMLRKNALWRCYDNTGTYDVLDKILVLVAKGHGEKKCDRHLIKGLLESGGEPGATLPNHKNKTALHYAAKFKDGKKGFKVAEILLLKCNANKREAFVNSADAKCRTPIHRAAELGHVRVCKLLLEYGARLDAKDEEGSTALHRAFAHRKSELVDLFTENHLIADCVDLKNRYGDSPLQLAIANENNIELVAKLLSKSREPEVYFSDVDTGQLLRQSLVKGYESVVKMLLQKGAKLSGGDVDDDGKTILQLATSCEDEKNARAMVELVRPPEIWAARCDKRGRGVLHEAALKGHVQLCKDFLEMNPKLINSKDKEGRIPLYDAVQGSHDNSEVWETLLAAYSKRGRSLGDVIDRNGQTPFHLAASKGKINILKVILGSSQFTQKQMKRADFLGQTALHKVAKLGDKDTINILLQQGARPFQERDCDGRTALHYVVQAKTGREGKELADLLLENCTSKEEKLLFLWASAAGLGPADQNLDDKSEVKKFLVEEKEKISKELENENLLQIAARMGYVEMTKELLSKGYQIADVQSEDWFNNKLDEDQKTKVKRVSEQIKSIAERGNDQPTRDDNLGRVDYAHGLAALLLNPYLKPPIAVGISGSWGMGKSSLMMQTEDILLKTVAELALSPGSTSNFPGVKKLEFSKKGRHIYERVKKIERDVESAKNKQAKEGFFAATIKKIGTNLKKLTVEKSPAEHGHNEGPSLDILKEYEPEHRDIYKSLAVMDNREMFTTISHEPHSGMDHFLEGSVPAIITVQYNAWKYRNETEAMAGMAVEITREMEERMTEAQWLSTCWRNTWRKNKYNICIEIIFPCILAILLACSFTWIVWLILDQYKMKEWAKAKYVCLPAALVIIVWNLAKTVIGVIKPVSTQLMQYISFPDHTEKLGYQQRVIDDINFLKVEIGRTPYPAFTALVRTFTALMVLWNFITALKGGIASFFSAAKQKSHLEKTRSIQKLGPPSNRNLRMIVFVDDLDRCQESVILQVLSAINLVLAVCEISVVLGMDKGLIERAIMKKYGDIKTKSFQARQELADKYLQKIIQLPLDLPEPSEEQSKSFLEGQLGGFHKHAEDGNDDSDTEKKKNAPHRISGRLLSRKTFESARARSGDSSSEDATASEDDAMDRKDEPEHNGAQSYDITVSVEPETQTRETGQPSQTSETLPNTDGSPLTVQGRGERGQPSQTGSETLPNTDGAPPSGNRNSSIPIREMLFVRYSAGEWDAICHFQKLATDSRKLPREWKRFLNYHRLVWNIFSISHEAKTLGGWQVQLITWIFVCWEWKENMNLLIEKWNNTSVLRTSESNGPSLRTIVDHLIEQESRDKNAIGDSQITKGKPEELVTDSNEPEISMKKTTEETVQTGQTVDRVQTKDPPEKKESRSEAWRGEKQKKRKDSAEGDNTGSSGEGACLEKFVDGVKGPLHTVEKSLRNELAELKKEIKGLKEFNELAELKKEIKGLKEFVMKQQTEKKAKREDETNIKVEKWRRMRYALERYDVSMEGIQAFQRFRFYCTAGHLPWPLPKDTNGEA